MIYIRKTSSLTITAFNNVFFIKGIAFNNDCCFYDVTPIKNLKQLIWYIFFMSKKYYF